MSWRKLFSYLLLLTLLLAFYCYQQGRTQKIRKIKEQKKQICPLETEEITKYNLKTEYDWFQLEKKEGKWRLIKPVNDWANRIMASELLETVVKIKIAETKITPIPKNISPYGLDRPKIEVSLITDEKTWTLQLGSDTPNGARVYALTTDKKAIYLLPSSLVWSLNKKLDNLRDKHIMDFDPVKVTRLSFQGKNINMVLEKDKGKWYIKTPFSAKADKGEVEGILYRLQAEQIKAFSKNAIYPELKIELWENINKPSYWLNLAKWKGDLIAQSNYHPTCFILKKDFWKEFTKGPEIFKDRHFVEFNKEKIDKAEISYGKKQLIAKKNKKCWEIKPKHLAQAYEIEFFLDDLLNLKYLPEKIIPLDLASSQAKVKLWDKENQLALDLIYYKHKNRNWVKYKDRFYPVDNNVWESFPAKIKEGEK